MKSAFGVVHKAAVPAALEPILPSTTVLAYNNSRKNKNSAAGRNLTAKIGGTAAGVAGGYLAYRGARKVLPTLKRASDFKVMGKPVTLSHEKKQGYALSALTSTGGGIGGYFGGKASLDRIKRDSKYQYRTS